MRKFLTAVLALTWAMSASSQQEADKYGMDTTHTMPEGRKVGDTIAPFTVQLADGTSIHSNELLEKGPMVVVFYRGYWCPYCTRHLAALEEKADEFKKRGVTLLAIGPEGAEGVEKTIDKSKAGFLVARDPEEKAMEEMDVLFHVTEKYQEKIRTMLKADIAENNEKDEAKLPVPATYVLDKHGVVRYVYFDINYRERSVADELIEVLKAID